jgi:hypothetical protein
MGVTREGGALAGRKAGTDLAARSTPSLTGQGQVGVNFFSQSVKLLPQSFDLDGLESDRVHVRRDALLLLAKLGVLLVHASLAIAR